MGKIEEAFENMWSVVFSELTNLTVSHREETTLLRQLLYQTLVDNDYNGTTATYKKIDRMEYVTIPVPNALREVLGPTLMFRSFAGDYYPYDRSWRPNFRGSDPATKQFFLRNLAQLTLDRGVGHWCPRWKCHMAQCGGTYHERCSHFPD